VEWKVGRKKGKGVRARDKKNKLSASLDRANHPTIVTQTPLDPIWEKVGRVEVGKLVTVGEKNCLPSPNHCSDCLVKGNKFVVC